MLVGTGDSPAFLATELGQATHEGAANTDDMDFQSELSETTNVVWRHREAQTAISGTLYHFTIAITARIG